MNDSLLKEIMEGESFDKGLKRSHKLEIAKMIANELHHFFIAFIPVHVLTEVCYQFKTKFPWAVEEDDGTGTVGFLDEN